MNLILDGARLCRRPAAAASPWSHRGNNLAPGDALRLVEDDTAALRFPLQPNFGIRVYLCSFVVAELFSAVIKLFF